MDLDKAVLRSLNPQYKKKSSLRTCYCPLCKVERKFRYQSKLSAFNYLQVVFISGTLGYLLFPLMKAKVVFMGFIVWMAFETLNKILFRKEIPCPDCGFDATWYRKDVKVARRKVAEYWQQVEQVKDANKAESEIEAVAQDLINHATSQEFEENHSQQF
jgi:hypothetical protein